MGDRGRFAGSCQRFRAADTATLALGRSSVVAEERSMAMAFFSLRGEDTPGGPAERVVGTT